MSQPICTLDQLIDQANMSESDREIAKAQIHRAEAIVDIIEFCLLSIRKLAKPLTHLRIRAARQH